jgi:hypothetical protein
MSNMSAVINVVNTHAKTGRQVCPQSDKLFATFDEAIAQGDLELAAATLRLIEVSIMLRSEDSPAAQVAIDELVASYNHLWMLRHPEALAA